MKVAGMAFVVGALVAACVPATEDLREPRGGVRAQLVASPETAGKPFSSVDGWTITIDKIAFRAQVQAMPRGAPYFGGGSSRARIVAPVPGCELKATAITPGPATAAVMLVAGYSEYDDDREEPCGVDAEMLERFRQPVASDYAKDYPPAYFGRPSLVIIARAEKNGRKIRLELGLGAELYDSGGTPVDIVANQGALARIGVFASTLFVPPSTPVENEDGYPTTPPAAIRFDDVAASDTNGDGVVTGSELSAAPKTCATRSSGGGRGGGGGGGGKSSGDGPDEDYDFGDFEVDDRECASPVTVIARWNAPQLFAGVANAPNPP